MTNKGTKLTFAGMKFTEVDIDLSEGDDFQGVEATCDKETFDKRWEDLSAETVSCEMTVTTHYSPPVTLQAIVNGEETEITAYPSKRWIAFGCDEGGSPCIWEWDDGETATIAPMEPAK